MDWIKDTLSNGMGIPSTKRHVVMAASAVLCLVSSALAIACTAWIWQHGDLGSGAVAALTFALGITAGLAGVSYRKPDGVEAPPATEARASASDSTSCSAKI